jgi:hypothetical protein
MLEDYTRLVVALFTKGDPEIGPSYCMQALTNSMDDGGTARSWHRLVGQGCQQIRQPLRQRQRERDGSHKARDPAEMALVAS